MRFKRSPSLFLQLTGLYMPKIKDQKICSRLRAIAFACFLLIPTTVYYCRSIYVAVRIFSTNTIQNVEYAVIFGWEFQSIMAIMFIFCWQRTGAIQFIEGAVKYSSSDNKSNYVTSLKMKAAVCQCLKIMLWVTIFGCARSTGANIERAIRNGIGILDVRPTMGLHPFDFVYRVIGFYEQLVVNCAVSYFAASVRCLTIRVEQFNSEFQEMLEFPPKDGELSDRLLQSFATHKALAQKVRDFDGIFRAFIFCMLFTGVPMTVFGAITLVRRETLLSFVFASYDFVFCIVQMIAFTAIPARLYSALHAVPSHIYWSPTLWTRFDPNLFQIARTFTENVQKLKVGLSFGGLVLIRKKAILMAFVLIVPYVILSYQLYVESSNNSHHYKMMTGYYNALNRTF